MAEERKQSPHYIPELDPESKKHRAGWLANLVLWAEYAWYIGFGLSLLTAGAAWAMGWDQVMWVSLIIAIAVGLLITLSLLG